MIYTIYTITDLRSKNVVYVGKTNDFERRKREHLSLNSKNTKVWISAIGIDNILITQIAEFSSEDEALKYEDELILRYNTIEEGFNEQRSGLIRASDSNAYYRRYYATNEEYRKNLLEHQKHYREEHRTQRLEQAKQYYESHKAQTLERTKQYYESHKAQTLERTKQYYEAHKEQILARAKMRYQNKKAQMQIQIDIADTTT